jgi:uncharacterized membrane protein YoaT (DUF817 family)
MPAKEAEKPAGTFFTKLKQFIYEFFCFGIKQAYACLFGGAFLAGIIFTSLFWQADWPLARYDFLVFYAIAIQIAFIFLKLETWEEVKVIFIFHVIGTIMEIFKTHVGSWNYPEHNILRIGGVPLFSGFMYSAVGSYIARAWKILELKFEYYPPIYLTCILCVLIYINFFTHHYTYDARPLLFAFTFFLFYRTRVYFKPNKTYFSMTLLMGWFLVALFIWIAENLGSFGRVWVYPNQRAIWDVVPLEKMGSWFLLMIISFVLVTLIHKDHAIYPRQIPGKEK